MSTQRRDVLEVVDVPNVNVARVDAKVQQVVANQNRQHSFAIRYRLRQIEQIGARKIFRIIHSLTFTDCTGAQNFERKATCNVVRNIRRL